MTENYQWIGYDAHGTPRVFGEGPTSDVAETEARAAVIEYVRRRPDTGPVSSWAVKPAE